MSTIKKIKQSLTDLFSSLGNKTNNNDDYSVLLSGFSDSEPKGTMQLYTLATVLNGMPQLGVSKECFLHSQKKYRLTLGDYKPNMKLFNSGYPGIFKTANFIFAGCTGDGTANHRLGEINIIGNQYYARHIGNLTVSHIALYRANDGSCMYIETSGIYYFLLPMGINCDYTIEEYTGEITDATLITID